MTEMAAIRRGAPHFDLWALASKSVPSEDEMRALAKEHFPVGWGLSQIRELETLRSLR